MEPITLKGIFEALSPEHQAALAPLGEVTRVPLGQQVVRQGELQTHVHLLLEGRLAASCQGFTIVELGEIKAGELVGELNFVDPLKASATVRAKTACEIWSIPCETLHEYCATHPDAGYGLMRALSVLLARRIRRAADKMLRQAETAAAMHEMDD